MTLCDPIDGSPPGSHAPGILQARTLEWVAISFSSAWKWKVKVKLLSHVWLVATPWTVAYQAPLSMGFSRQEYWTGLPLPFPPKRWDGQFCLKMLILIHTSWWRSMWDGKAGLWELGTGGQGSLLPHLSRNSIHSTKERKERIPDFKKLVFYRTVENSNASPMNKKATTQSRCGQLLELACSFWRN